LATLRMQRQHVEVPDYVHLQLSYPTHEVILHASALTALVAPRFTVHGEHGSYVSHALDTQEDQLKAGLRPGQPGYGRNLPGQLRTGNAERQTDTAWNTLDGNYPGFYRALADSLLDGVAFPIVAQDAVDVMHIVELAQRSNDEGRRLPFRRLG
jgi:predicted dehydrogenase